MNDYKSFLNDLVESKQVRALTALIEHVLPELGQEEMNVTRTVMDSYMQSADHREIITLMSEKVGVNEETSSAYLLARINNPLLDREDIDYHVRNLKDLYGHILTTAIFHGDIEVARLVDHHHSSRYPVNFGYVSHVGPCVDGKEINTRVEFTSFTTIADIEEVFEILIKAGLAQLLGRGNDGSAWLLTNKLQGAANAARNAVSIPALPALSKGRLDHCELILALEDRRAASSYPELFNKVLIWVDDHDVESTPGVQICARRQFTMGTNVESKVVVPNVKSTAETFPLESFQAVMDRNELYRADYGSKSGLDAVSKLFIGLEPENCTTLEAGLFYNLSQYMLTPHQRMGIDMPKGKTLFMMNIDELLGREIGQVDDSSLIEAQRFTSSFFPLEMLITYRDKKSIMERDVIHCDTGIASHKPGFKDDLFERLADPVLSQIIGGLVPGEMLKSYFDTFALTVNETNLARAIEHHKFTFDRNTYQFDRSKVIALRDAGVRLAEVTEAGFSKYVNFGALVNRTPDTCLAAMQIGLWPGRVTESNLTIKACITKALQLKNDIEYPALLRFYGPEAVAPMIKTEPQMRLFERTFTSQELRECLQKLPKKMRDITFAGDLGL